MWALIRACWLAYLKKKTWFLVLVISRTYDSLIKDDFVYRLECAMSASEIFSAGDIIYPSKSDATASIK